MSYVIDRAADYVIDDTLMTYYAATPLALLMMIQRYAIDYWRWLFITVNV